MSSWSDDAGDEVDEADGIAEDDGVLEPADSLLTDRLDSDPLDEGITTADSYSVAEHSVPESLDDRLAEEEPDEPPEELDDAWDQGPTPRAGRLVADGTTTAARDVGPDGGAAGAEEAAVHLVEDEDYEGEYEEEPPEPPLPGPGEEPY